MCTGATLGDPLGIYHRSSTARMLDPGTAATTRFVDRTSPQFAKNAFDKTFGPKTLPDPAAPPPPPQAAMQPSSAPRRRNGAAGMATSGTLLTGSVDPASLNLGQTTLLGGGG